MFASMLLGIFYGILSRSHVFSNAYILGYLIPLCTLKELFYSAKHSGLVLLHHEPFASFSQPFIPTIFEVKMLFFNYTQVIHFL